MEGSKSQEVKNVILSGGGAKCIAQMGVLRGLDLTQAERLGGASGGGLIMMLRSTGFSIAQIEEEMASRSFADFLDGLSKKAHKKFSFFQENIGQKPVVSALSLLPVKGELKSNLKEGFGIFEGDELLQWALECTSRHSGIKNLTFQELHELHLKDPIKYKDLYLIGTDITQPGEVVYSFETHPNGIIGHAGRITSGYPFVYKSHCMHYKYPKNQISIDENRHAMVDGGLSNNCPLHLFDEKRYIEGENPNDRTVIKNPQTIAVMLVTGKDNNDNIEIDEDRLLRPTGEFAMLIKYANLILNATFIKQDSLLLDHPEDYARVIKIDDLGVRTFSLSLTPEMTEALIQSGELSEKLYFQKTTPQNAQQELENLRTVMRMLDPKLQKKTARCEIL